MRSPRPRQAASVPARREPLAAHPCDDGEEDDAGPQLDREERERWHLCDRLLAHIVPPAQQAAARIRNARFRVAAQRVACGHWLLTGRPARAGRAGTAGQQSHGQFGPQSQSQDVIELTSFHAGLVARTIAECMLGHAMRRDDLDVGQADTLSPALNSRNDRAPAMQPTYEPRSARCSGSGGRRDDVTHAHPAAGPEHSSDLAEDGGLVGRQVDDAVVDDHVDARARRGAGP